MKKLTSLKSAACVLFAGCAVLSAASAKASTPVPPHTLPISTIVTSSALASTLSADNDPMLPDGSWWDVKTATCGVWDTGSAYQAEGHGVTLTESQLVAAGFQTVEILNDKKGEAVHYVVALSGAWENWSGYYRAGESAVVYPTNY